MAKPGPKGGRVCSVEACGRPHKSKGYCGGHYRRVRVGAQVDAPMESRRGKDHTLGVLSQIDSAGGGCHEWTGYRDARGYGVYGSGAKVFGTQLAHRIAWIINFGPIPTGLSVCHHCDNPPCCNLAHLFLGTQAENMSDMARKGRQYSKLTADQVVEIRRGLSSGKSRAELSSTYGVDVTTIGLIARGEWWRHTW